MVLVSDMLHGAPVDEDRLRWERVSRQYLQRIFACVMADRMERAYAIFLEAREEGDWMHVAVWAGLPGTVKERFRELDHETRGTGRDEGCVDPDVALGQ